jgi:hypothetical protein
MAGRGRRALDAGAARHRVPRGRARLCANQRVVGAETMAALALAVAQGRRQGYRGQAATWRSCVSIRPRWGPCTCRSDAGSASEEEEQAEGLHDRHAVARARPHRLACSGESACSLETDLDLEAPRESGLRGGRHLLGLTSIVGKAMATALLSRDRSGDICAALASAEKAMASMPAPPGCTCR